MGIIKTKISEKKLILIVNSDKKSSGMYVIMWWHGD